MNLPGHHSDRYNSRHEIRTRVFSLLPGADTLITFNPGKKGFSCDPRATRPAASAPFNRNDLARGSVTMRNVCPAGTPAGMDTDHVEPP